MNIIYNESFDLNRASTGQSGVGKHCVISKIISKSTKAQLFKTKKRYFENLRFLSFLCNCSKIS